MIARQAAARRDQPGRPHQEAVVYPRAAHGISRRQISEAALSVLYRLHKAGYQAHLVGGSVRDLLLGRQPKDFDVVTDARPAEVRELFRHSRLIGRRFRLVHVRYGREIIEVSTFRAPHAGIADGQGDKGGGGRMEGGRIIRDNVYGSMDEDVWRRDFTINALFYSISDRSVIDYVDGMRDIKSGRIRLIGNPEQRFVEDPVRLLRAVRFAAKLGFVIHADAARHISRLAPLLADMSAARLFEECLKMFMSGHALQTFEQLRHYQLFAQLFPQTEAALVDTLADDRAHDQAKQPTDDQDGFARSLPGRALDNTDRRLAAGQPVTPGFLLAALLWPPLVRLCRRYIAQGQSRHDALALAGDVALSRQVGHIAIPRRFSQMAREVWQLQPRLLRKNPPRPLSLLRHPKFRAAYDFLLLRAEASDSADDEGNDHIRNMAEWWTAFQQDNPAPERPRRRGHRPRRPPPMIAR